MKKLCKDLDNKDIFGVIAGLAKYFNLDRHNLRIIWIVITCLTGILPGVFIYMVAAVVISEPPIKK
ncbi:MAG: PspC domain-containing protein [Candidatus Nealsonbacteria bacterium]|nr:PspC domain-containing protein [Candidatus Nealsonbacteria bacterium]